MATPNTSVPWVAVALADIQNARPGPLVAAFQSTALAAGQSDPTTAIIQKCTTELLAAVGYSGRVVMDASQGNVTPDVVPPNLFDRLVEKICRSMAKRVNYAWTVDEQNDERSYQKMLQGLMSGTVAVYATSNPGAASSLSAAGGAVASVGSGGRLFKQYGGGWSGNGSGFCGGNPL